MAHKFIIDDTSGALYKDFTGRRVTTAAELLQAERGLTPTFEIYSINVATDTGAVTGQTLTNGNLSVAIGLAGKAPEKGLVKAAFTVSGTTYESASLEIENINGNAIESAFNNSVYPVYNAGGLTVDELGEGKWLLTMKKVGAITGSPSLNVESSDPPSAVEVNSVRTGDSDTKAQWIINLIQSPVANIATGSWSSATSGSYSGLSSTISLNTTAMLSAIARGQRDFEISIIHSGQVLHRSSVSIHESLDPTAAGSIVVTSPTLFTLGSNAVNQGETIAISGGLTYDGTTLAAPFLPLAGGTMTGSAIFNDNVKAIFGTSSDGLEVYHDGSDSYITDTGTGDLIIQGSNDIWIMNGSDTAINTNDNGSVDLYYNNSKKFETSNIGATITGKLTVTGDLDVDGTTTTFDSTVVTVDDPVFGIGGDTAPSSYDNKDRGISFRYFRSGESAKVGFFGFDNSANAFTFLTDTNDDSTEVFSGTAGNLNVGNVLFGDGSAGTPAISFSGDTNTGLFSVADDQLGISTGGTERVHVYNDGFDLNNLSLVFKDSGGTGRATVSIPSQHFAINVYGTSGWINNVLNIDNDTGHIGIGTASPAASLQIDTPAANNAGQGIRINRPSAGTNYHSVEFSTDGTVDWSVGQNSNDAFEIYEDGASATTRFTIKEGGNVGVGTTAPVGKLTVVDTTSSATAQKFHVGRATNAGLYITDTDDSSYIKAIQDEDEAGYGNLILAADSAGSKDGFISFESEGEKMRITADGKVGIGTTAPASKLHVTGTVQVGVDDTGHDVKFFGATSGRYMLWDESADLLQLADGVQLILGNGNDLSMVHDGSQTLITNYVGNLTFKQESVDSDIIFQCDDGSGGVETYFFLDGSLSSGDPYTIFPDDSNLAFGTGGDLIIKHDGTNSHLNNYTGGFYITQHANDGDLILRSDDGSGGFDTYYYLDGSEGINKFSKDVYIGINGGGNDLVAYGATSSKYVHWDASNDALILPDSTELRLGTGSDFRLYHDGTNSWLNNATGDLKIRNSANDKDIIFECDDGSGGTETYFFLDGSDHQTKFAKDLKLEDSVVLQIGTGNDLQAYHDGSNSIISNATGDLYFINSADDKDIIFQSDNGSGGIETYFFLDGSLSSGNPYTIFPDSSILSIGSGSDLNIQHDGNNSYLDNNTGDLIIQNYANDKDIIFKSDDGEGGTATYFKLDGSYTAGIDGETYTPSTVFPDHALLALGTHRDLKLWYNNVRGRIAYTGGNEFVITALNNLNIGFNDSDGVHTETAITCYKDDRVQIRHDNSPKFETQSDGVKVYGATALTETTTPTATADVGKIYTKTDNKLYFQDGAGTEHEIAFA